MTGQVVCLDDYRDPWTEVLRYSDATDVVVHVYVNRRDGSVDLVQCNSEGEAISSNIPAPVARMLINALEEHL